MPQETSRGLAGRDSTYWSPLPSAQLDHIVILLPISQLHSLPSWLSDNFTISPGGTHADGRTENVLILLGDGVYIELIAFTSTTSPESRATHRWGKKPYGVVDYAFTLDSKDTTTDYKTLVEQWNREVVDQGLYAKGLVAGGRTRPDGTVLKWEIAAPHGDNTGKANFWCLDVTPRELRVPLSKKGTTHPSGVVGVGEGVIHLPEEEKEALGRLFEVHLDKKDGGYGIATPTQPDERNAKIRLESGDAHKIGLTFKSKGKKGVIKGDIGGTELEITLV